MSLYPPLEISETPASQFRPHKINEVEKFLISEVESRGRIQKKYQRAVTTLDGVCGALGSACIVAGPAGAGLLASGIGFIPGVALEVITGVVGLLGVAGIAVSHRCSKKAAKHEAIRILALSKLNTVHSHISKALEDNTISDDEYKLILDEVEKYRVMKEELRHKHAPASSMIDEKTKNELIKRGQEEARALFMKKITGSESPSPFHV